MTGESHAAHASSAPIGLIAGEGRLPLLVAEGMRRAGRRICAVGLAQQFDGALPSLCDEFQVAGIARVSSWLRVLRRAGVHEAIMVGRVAKASAHDPFRIIRYLPDWRTLRLWYRRIRHDRRNAALLAALADELQREGVTLIDSTMFIADQLATPGVMGRIAPGARQRDDLEFGWPVLQQVVELDIGQSIAVRERDVLAVEAVEGTDGMIDRAGALCRAKGWTMLKTSRRDHDQRADVPTIGVQTISKLAAAGASCLAVGAGRVILIDKPLVIRAADDAGIALVGLDRDAPLPRAGTGT